MLSGLALTGLVFMLIVAAVGISDIGEAAIGGEGTITHAVNATLWSTYGSFGSLPFAIIVGSLALFLLVCLIYSIGRSE